MAYKFSLLVPSFQRLSILVLTRASKWKYDLVGSIRIGKVYNIRWKLAYAKKEENPLATNLRCWEMKKKKNLRTEFCLSGEL